MDLGDLVNDNRPAKRARRTQAAKREAELARVEDKWADLDITKFRCTTDCDNRKTFATLQPAAGDWTVSQWRNPNAYVQDKQHGVPRTLREPAAERPRQGRRLPRLMLQACARQICGGEGRAGAVGRVQGGAEYREASI